MTDLQQTESGVRVIAHAPDGTETNITEGVMALFDLVISSLDWGSGFWTAEDAAPVAFVARTCGFPSIGEVECYLADRQHAEERNAFWDTIGVYRFVSANRFPQVNTHPDEHVWSTVGKCMWPGCAVENG